MKTDRTAQRVQHALPAANDAAADLPCLAGQPADHAPRLGQCPCQRIRPQLEEIKALGERERPVYVFAHILLPHGPYNFSADGECLTQLQSQQRGSRQGYIDQARFASRIIEELVSHLLAEGRAEPVILIHADEGPFPEGRDPKVPWQELPNEQLRIKTAILNAYYLPDGQYEQLNEETSPVNSFRVIFNALFGTDFEILTERTFVSQDDRHLYAST